MKKAPPSIRFLAIGWALLLGGCAATQLEVVYDSQPSGAMISSAGKVVGPAPVTLNYVRTKSFLDGGCMNLAPVTAQWLSGAQAISSANACAANGSSQIVRFSRPAHPGLAVDANYALQLQRNQIMQKQAEAAQDAADAAQQQMWNAAFNPSSTTCTSRKVGYTVVTDCN